MNKGVIIITIICFLCFKANTQNNSKENIVGTSYTIPSTIMQDEREVQIYLPDGYGDSDIKYPVLYILDGQRYFLHGVSLQKSFKSFKQAPDFIVVGISKNPADRNRNYSVNSKKYLDFIKKEVIELVESQFRVSNKKLLFGWAFGGGFALETMTREPNLFNAYIAASPFPLNEKVNKIDSLITNVSTFNKFLFFTAGANEGAVNEGVNQLNALLKEKAPETMDWSFQEFEGEEHRSTPFTTLYHGIKKYFKYYAELQFSSLEDFEKAGGLDYVYEHYQKRANEYGFSKELSDFTMFSITRNAIRADNFSQFDALVNEFNKTDFISRLRVRRACSIAKYYLDNDQYEKALELYMLIAEKNPKIPLPFNGLGDTYKKLKQDKKAASYYKKAEQLAKKR